MAADRLAEAADGLRRLGCTVDDDAAVPMTDGEVVVSASGPENAECAVTKVPGVKAVHPDSDVTLY